MYMEYEMAQRPDTNVFPTQMWSHACTVPGPRKGSNKNMHHINRRKLLLVVQTKSS